MVTDAQVKLYREKLASGRTRQAAAAAADMTAKTARKWEVGPLPSQCRKERAWRTRQDPLEGAFERLVVPLLEDDKEGELQATTILDALKEAPGAEVVRDAHLRTLQRRIREWRVKFGPEREVFFEQVHPPGREVQVDFTHCEELGVTVSGVPFPHLLFEMILSYSGWRFVQLAYSETYEALVRGLQDGFWTLGGLPQVARSDNLSAATYQLHGTDKRKPTKRFQGVLTHFGLEYTRIVAGKSNQNGKVEKAHDILKTALRQALKMRGSLDFRSIDAYLAFVEVVRERLNARAADRLAEERRHLRPLRVSRLPTYTDVPVKVARWSTVRVAENTYSVPSRLIGHEVVARLHADSIDVIYRGHQVDTFPRLRGRSQHRINYRHIIHSMVAKPGAFARYRYREDLFPSVDFRRAYDTLRHYRGERADVDYVRILHLAATTMEAEVEAALQLLLQTQRAFDFGDVKSLVDISPRPPAAQVQPFTPDLKQFDNLLEGTDHDPRETRVAVAV